MKLTFVDLNLKVCQALQDSFPEAKALHLTLDAAIAHLEKQDDLPDAVVSPANSFGIMDGGFDLALRNYFGKQLQEHVQEEIREVWKGEQPIGTAVLVPTYSNKVPWLIHAPTMRVPMPIGNTLNVYDAMRAILNSADAYNTVHAPLFDKPINHILLSGLGTSAGQMHPEQAAHYMRLAWDSMHDLPPVPLTWGEWVQNRIGKF